MNNYLIREIDSSELYLLEDFLYEAIFQPDESKLLPREVIKQPDISVYIDENEELGKKIYRRNADNPQAFAVLVGNKWIGSMSTKNWFNKSMVNSVPFFFPPQILIIDDEYYQASIIHEMVHAYEAKKNNKRFLRVLQDMQSIKLQ